MSTATLRHAIRRGLNTYTIASAAATALGLTGTSAVAQTTDKSAPDQKSQALETIVVTGSNIRRVDYGQFAASESLLEHVVKSIERVVRGGLVILVITHESAKEIR